MYATVWLQPHYFPLLCECPKLYARLFIVVPCNLSLWTKILDPHCLKRIENINGDSAESDYLHYVLLGVSTHANSFEESDGC